MLHWNCSLCGRAATNDLWRRQQGPRVAAVETFHESVVPEDSYWPDFSQLLAVHRPRFGDVGVQFIDNVLILLFNDAAFELHREGKGAIVEGEVIRQEGETLDG